MNILLLGGTGAMGVDLAQLYAANGHHVSITSRSKRASQAHVSYIQGNARDSSFLASVLSSSWDLIVDFMIYNTEEFAERIDLLLNSSTRYIFLSSARVYAESDTALQETSSRLLDSSTDETYLATEEYALSKARQENFLRNANKKNWIIVRPYITYNNYRLQLGCLEKEQWLHRAIRGHSILLPESIANKTTTLTHGKDVARAIFTLSMNSNIDGETYHLTGSDSLTWSEIADIYINTLKSCKGIRAGLQLLSDEEFATVHHGKYQLIYDRQFNRTFSTEKIAHLVDVDNFVSIKEGLEYALSEFLNTPSFNYISWENEAMQDRLCKQRAALNKIVGWRARLRYLRTRFMRY